MSRKFISIDPGLSGTGVAVWESCGDGEWDLYEACSLALKSQDAYVQKIAAILRQHDDEVEKVFIEEPCLMSSETGTVAARSGALVKLCMIAGAIAGVSSLIAKGDCNGIKVHMVPVSEWKGTSPKDVTKERVMRALPNKVEKGRASHYYDAIGIGIHAIRKGYV